MRTDARLDPMDALIAENAALARALGAAQARCTRQVAVLARRIEQLECELRQRRECSTADSQPSGRRNERAKDAARDRPATAPLADRAVLCVGGRPATVPLYRLVVERTGGRFLHHDGAEADPCSRLDATLAAADLVICQTGGLGHDAIWRVKDHCRRTGKRCIFVRAPGRIALEHALADALAAV